ncbi:hypothetical protein [Spongiimicrobium salis]|uniref:hypothetical protein n=1 Tax=Spongiimicrobium salis TaxID=1667022 RepID=UPI00374D8857
MISSIFGKTKPINFIIVLSFLFLFYWGVHFFVGERTYEIPQLLLQAIVLNALLFSIFITNFIIKKNKLTGVNSFAVLFYAMLIVVFPEVLMDDNAIWCSFFLLLATRRLLSIRSLKSIKSKTFDATLWVVVASLFYDWAIIYVILVFAAIYFYDAKNIRNWLIPLVAFCAVFMIGSAVLILFDNSSFLTTHYRFSALLEADYFFDWETSTKLIVYGILIIGIGILAFVRLGNVGTGRIVTIRLIAISYTLGLLMTILASSEDISPVIVTFFPAVIFMTNYVEALQKAKIKEAILVISILAPFILFLFSLSSK